MVLNPIPLENLDVLQFIGPDAANFLQSQLTADIGRLDGDSAGFACVCNPQGRVLGLLLLGRTDADTLTAICDKSLAAGLVQHLSRYVLRAKVSIRHRTDLAVAGLPDGCVNGAEPIELSHFAGRYAIVDRCATGAQTQEVAVRTWRIRELLHGVNWLDTTTQGEFLPQMLGLQAIGALSFTKGCYPGQEIIARTRHLGKLKRHPLLCLLAGPSGVAPGQEVTLTAGGEDASAVVIDAVATEAGDTLAMLVARTPEGFAAEYARCGEDTLVVRWSAAPGPDTQLP